MKRFDYLIVGAGLFGSVFAHEAHKKGKTCLVIDKRDHIGGNVYTKSVEGIDVHYYGAHIFHTNNRSVWEYVNRFSDFNRYTNSPLAQYRDELYNLPFNMNTFHAMWGVKAPEEAKRKIREQIAESGITSPGNLEEQAVMLVGYDIYEKLIKGYTEKQWGRSATELPAFIIKRLPVRFTYDNNYFNDAFQGIPLDGYTGIVEKMLDGIDVELEKDFFNDYGDWREKADALIYTGMIDRFYDYRYGELEYRSLRFEHQLLDCDNYQGNAVVNYTERDIPYTRIIEHKHFAFGTQDKTVITKEYPADWSRGEEPYYPVNNDRNNSLFKRYLKEAEKEKNVYFGGRLGLYKYFNMDQVIEKALELSEAVIEAGR